MPAMPFDRIPDDARVWVFAASRELTPDESAALLRHVDGFLERWNAHGAPVVGAREWRHGRFLLVAADEAATGVSGCSIDSLQHAMAAAEQEFGADLRSAASLVFFRDGSGAVRGVPRPEFRRLAQSGEIGDDTLVFDNTAATLGNVRAGRWERPFRDSWHARTFPIGAPAS
jgi:hypothetical protein